MAKGKKNGNGNRKTNQKELVAVAEEMNEVMGLEPAIDTELPSKEGLIKEIKANATEIEPGDEFSKETQKMLEKLGVATEDKSPEKEVEDKEEPEEEEETEEIIEEDVKEKKTAKTEKDVKEKKTKTTKEKSCYGHQVGSIGALIDDLVQEGTSLESAVKTIMKKFPNRDERLATNKVKVHVNHLIKARGIKIDVDEKKHTYKAQ